MATYEYACSGCGGTFEVEQSIKDAPLERCDLCGAPDVKRLVSGCTFVLKGGGWYADGYSPGSSKKET